MSYSIGVSLTIPVGVHSPWSALAITAVPALPCSANASDGAIVYGRINVSMATSGTQRANRLSNNRSVLGFSGEEDLGDGLRAI